MGAHGEGIFKDTALTRSTALLMNAVCYSLPPAMSMLLSSRDICWGLCSLSSRLCGSNGYRGAPYVGILEFFPGKFDAFFKEVLESFLFAPVIDSTNHHNAAAEVGKKIKKIVLNDEFHFSYSS